MKENINANLQILRSKMKNCGISAVIIPQADPHMSEYLSSHWQVRRLLSGFTGSAGDLVVSLDKALLWTDSRYFLQAGEQLSGTEIELMKDGLPETPSIGAWICENIKAGETIGIDGMVYSCVAKDTLETQLGAFGIKLIADFDVINEIWTDRPALPECKIFVHELKYAGETTHEKIAKVLANTKNQFAKSVFISASDEIAWILNIRSNDVPYNPVATSFLYLSDENKVLFVNSAKITPEVAEYLKGEGVVIAPYDSITTFLAAIPEDEKVLIEATRTASRIGEILGLRAVRGTSAAALLKACKNDVQLQGIRHAMIRDGVAMVKSLCEIQEKVANGEKLTEICAAEILRKHRKNNELFFDESFGTISGYGPHGAIVHYEADTESNSTLHPEGLLLLDSGAQYLDGTTDITRTIALSPTPTAQEKRDFTLVMKGHIALGTMIYPEGTAGAQLDAMARQFLWKEGLSYLHGTGHGVGHFLNVHEGPHSIRLNYVPTPLTPGMITSNEPGLYREGLHGIRCENLVLTVEAMTTEFGRFYKFETLTLCPFDRSLFDTSIMTEIEIDWVNNYHKKVRESLSPYLQGKSLQWLINNTEKL